MRKRFWKGLRTIDLAIGVSIICMVLVIVALNYDEVKCRAMQSEAKFSLQEIYLSQQLYFAEHERYAPVDQLLSIDSRAMAPQKYYILSDFFRPTGTNFVVLAKGRDGTLVAGEEWSIDQNNELRMRKQVCKN